MRSDYVGTGGRIIMDYYVYAFSVYHVCLSSVAFFIHSSVDDIESHL
jgi:hypothetical protein